MELETDDMRLQSLQMLGAVCLSFPGGDVVAIFDNSYAGSGNDSAIEGTEPRLTLRTSDVERVAIRKGQFVTIDQAQYRVVRHEPDGTGMSTVVLQS